MEMTLRKYAPLWNKYRPAILKMMLAATTEPQQYKLMQHEIVAMDRKKKGSFGFNLKTLNGKAANKIKDSEMAQDLLNMLQQSPKGSELLAANQYDITMDRDFTLRISQVVADKPVDTDKEATQNIN